MDIHEHAVFQEALDLLIRRVDSSTYTIASVRESLFDPISQERRADLLIAAENLANEAMTLVMEVREIAWSQAPTPQPPNVTSGNEN
jgi:hypothetical protein